MLTFEQLPVYKTVLVTGCFATSSSLSRRVRLVHLNIFHVVTYLFDYKHQYCHYILERL